MRRSMHSDNTGQPWQVAIIGAGPAGIGTAKCLIEAGHTVTVFEKSDDIGGIWKYREDRPGGVYQSTVYQTSKYMSGFSDFPMDGATPTFPGHADILAYLRDYVAHFGLRPYMELNAEVRAARRDDGGWLLTIARPGSVVSQRFDAIAVCNGSYWEAIMPALPGAACYRGTVLHSSRYKHPEVFRDKKVVVIGGGVSGMDIAVEASRLARRVEWSVGERHWIKPRWLGVVPYEAGVAHGIHLSRDELLAHWRTWIPRHHDACSAIGFLPAKAPFGEALGANDEIVELVHRQVIGCRARATAMYEDGCEFADGTRASADIVVFATGYRANSFPFFDAALLQELGVHDEGVDLFHHVFHPDIDNCAFIFRVTANAPALPTIELQARWFGQVLNGHAALPPPQEMRDWVDGERRRRRETLNRSAYRSNFIDGAYLLKLAQLIGVVPDKMRCFADYCELLRPPSFPPIYRVRGENAWSQANQSIAELKRQYPLKALHFGDAIDFVLMEFGAAELLDLYKSEQIDKPAALRALSRAIGGARKSYGQ